MKQEIIAFFLTLLLLAIFVISNSSPFFFRKPSLRDKVQEELPPDFKDRVTICFQYKCWAYRTEFYLNLYHHWNDRELCQAAIEVMRAYCRAMEKDAKKWKLYYPPSNLYLYEGFLKENTSKLMLFIENGIFELVKHQENLTPEEKKKYKDQLGTDPKFDQSHKHITIWKKTFEEVLEYTGMVSPEIVRNALLVLNFSEDPAIREAILTVTNRILDTLKEKDGYDNYVSVPFDKLALANKEGPYHWMFFVRKKYKNLKDRNEKPIPYDPEAYIAEYKRLHQLILTMINEAPELQTYLERPVVPRDLELSYTWSQQLWEGEGNFIEAYDHIVYRTHCEFVMERDQCDYKTDTVDFKQKKIPLEIFFQMMGF